MAKYLKTDGDYTVKTGDPGKIILDPGSTGYVEVNGNLTVKGVTTTIESTVASINDNIIILNAGETSGSVSLGSAGIQIDRTVTDGASGNDVYWAYHDDTPDPINGRGDLKDFILKAVVKFLNNDFKDSCFWILGSLGIVCFVP